MIPEDSARRLTERYDREARAYRELWAPALRRWNVCLDEHGATPLEPASRTRHDLVDRPEKVEALLREAGFASARAWTGELAFTLDSERLVRLRTSMGAPRLGYRSLTPEARSACVTGARLGMAGLAPGDFVARGQVVYGVGEA